MDTTNKKIIHIEVRDEYILGSGVSIGAAGSYDSMILQVKFDDSWAGLNKYATWSNAIGEMADQTIITPFNGVDGFEDTYYIPVPASAAKYAGTVKLSFTGYALSRGGDDRTVESLINTASGSFRVLESNAVPLDGAGTAPSVAEQLLNQLDAHMTEVNGEVEAIENRASAVEERMTTVEGKMEAVEGAEEERIAAENERIEAEKARDGNEVIRQINEFGAEGNRYDSVQGCVVDENGVKVENDQAGRVGAEIQRQSNEDTRKANETRRANAETNRANAETSRVSAEANRVGAENQRMANETNREKRFAEMVGLDGDIHKALDRIIEIQETLIGGDA